MPIRYFQSALLILTACATTLAEAAVTLVGGFPMTASDDANGNTSFSNIVVQAGDYVVISTASNKSFASNLLTYSWSGTEGVSGTSTSLSAEQTYAAYLSYTSVLVGGTYNFSILAANSSLTANSALYVLRPGGGEMITVAGTATQAQAAGTAAELSYLFGSSVTSGFAIEAATTQSGGAFTLDANYATPNSSAASNGRLISYSSAVNGTVWTSSHDFAAATDDIASVGAIFTSTSSVPEPSRLLLALGGLGIFTLRRRR